MTQPDEWSFEGFLSYFAMQETTMPDQAFAWVIGAGASRQSGIPTGGELVHWWLQELHQRSKSKESLEEWATEKNLEIEDFEYKRAAESYPWIFDLRFRGYPEEGYAYLEHVMTGKAKRWQQCRLQETNRDIQPSPGYSILAKIMEDTRHKAVITTNFDNLMADALHIYTSCYPLVCGHESLTGFIQAAMRRPIVCKIHRDLLLHPLNDRRSLRRMHEAWSGTLRTLFSHYTPIFVGYGGNDESLMGQLESLASDEIKGRLIWCYYEGQDKQDQPNERIRKLVTQHGGALVAIPDFDRFMILLGATMKLEPLDDVLGERAKTRQKDYQDSILGMRTDDYPQIIPAIRATLRRANSEWWSYQLEVDAERSLSKKDVLFQNAIKQLPNSSELLGNYATFVWNERKDLGVTESLYKRAIDADPKKSVNLGNYATFLWEERQDLDGAEALYKRAIDADPKDSLSLGRYANFLWQERKDLDGAEAFYKRAIDADPKHSLSLCRYAVFLEEERKDLDGAEAFYKRAIDEDPKHAYSLCKYATFLRKERKDLDGAEAFYKRAIDADPKHAYSLSRYATFLEKERKDLDSAEAFYKRAIDADPKHAYSLGAYVFFLTTARKSYESAVQYAKQRLELTPCEPDWTCNTSALLIASGAFNEAAKLWNAQSKPVFRDEHQAVLLLHTAVRQTLEGESPDKAVAELRQMLVRGFDREAWTFELFWDAHGERLGASDLKRLKALGDAIADPAKVGLLDKVFRRKRPEKSPAKRMAAGPKGKQSK